MSTGKIQHKDQGFKRSFYYIRLYAHTCLRGDGTQTFSGIVDSPKDVASSGSFSHYWNNHNEAEASKEKKKAVKLTYLVIHSPNIIVLMIIIYVYKKTPNCHIYFVCATWRHREYFIICQLGFYTKYCGYKGSINIYICFLISLLPPSLPPLLSSSHSPRLYR